MALLNKYDLSGRKTGELKLEDNLLEQKANSQMIKDYIIALRANRRQWSANTQTRFEVNHSGKKPHPQKGTGNARQGYLGAPQYRGGARVFGPKPKFDQHVRINRRERKAALIHLLLEKITHGHLHVLEQPKLEKPQTKLFGHFLEQLKIGGRSILFLNETQATGSERYSHFSKSVRNIPKTKCALFANINGYDLLASQHLVLLDSAWKELVQVLEETK